MTAPVSIVAGLLPPLAVSPLTPGSVWMIFTSIKLGRLIFNNLFSQKIPLTVKFSFKNPHLAECKLRFLKENLPCTNCAHDVFSLEARIGDMRMEKCLWFRGFRLYIGADISKGIDRQL